ncbi:MAG: hypothetical protein M3044_08265, partial [Thermoproteota archaeon]|nr:hypothetical protein [Thermoproteota archaeon]
MVFKITTFTHKASPELDFCTFFHIVDNTTRNSMLKQQPTAPASLYLYSSKNQTTTSYSLTICDVQDGGRMTDALDQLIDENPHDYYSWTSEAWGAQGDCLPGYQYGDIFKLPIEKKKENLVVSGKSNDEKQTRTILYVIIRARPGDDTSLVLHFEKTADSEDGSKFLSRTDHRQLLSEMQKSAIINRNRRPRFISPNNEFPIAT